MYDSEVILLGEIRSLSLQGVKGLTKINNYHKCDWLGLICDISYFLFAAGCSMSNVLQAMEVSLILMTTDVDIKAAFVTDS